MYFSCSCPFSKESIDRAIIKRCEGVGDLPEGYHVTYPRILQSTLAFTDSQELLKQGKERISPAASGRYHVTYPRILQSTLAFTDSQELLKQGKERISPAASGRYHVTYPRILQSTLAFTDSQEEILKQGKERISPAACGRYQIVIILQILLRNLYAYFQIMQMWSFSLGENFTKMLSKPLMWG